MLALAPSGLFQVPGERDSGVALFSDLVRRLPCFQVELGRNHREVADSIDEGLTQAEDADFLFRTFETGAKYRLTDTIAIYYRRHSGNATNDGRATVRGMMHAMQKSVARRKENPGASIPKDIFDLRDAGELLK